MELQKKLTDYMKRFLGLKTLTLWEGRAGVFPILDLQAAIERMRYMFANPIQANLVAFVSEYPGLISWESFICMEPCVNSVMTTKVPWVRQRCVKQLQRYSISRRQDAFIAQGLTAGAEEFHDLQIFPFAWMKCFGINDPAEVARVRLQIIEAVHATEQRLVALRKSTGGKVIGAPRLVSQYINRAHTPKKKDGKIFVISSIKALRVRFIKKVKDLCALCEELFDDFKRGIKVSWPSGIFPAASPMIANAISLH